MTNFPFNENFEITIGYTRDALGEIGRIMGAVFPRGNQTKQRLIPSAGIRRASNNHSIIKLFRLIHFLKMFLKVKNRTFVIVKKTFNCSVFKK